MGTITWQTLYVPLYNTILQISPILFADNKKQDLLFGKVHPGFPPPHTTSVTPADSSVRGLSQSPIKNGRGVTCFIKRLPLTCMRESEWNVNAQINLKPAKIRTGVPHEQTILNWIKLDAVFGVTLPCDCVFVPSGPAVKRMFKCSFRKKTNGTRAQTVLSTKPNTIKMLTHNCHGL